MKNIRKKTNWVREILEVIAAFAVAFVGYQLLAAVTGTPLPVVAVVSDSMYHNSQFDNWWLGSGGFYERTGITKDEFLAFPFRNGLSRGDLLLVVSEKPRPGDVVIYEKPEQGISIVHRVIEEQATHYIIKGDNNFAADAPVPKERVIGRVVFAVPLLGYPRFLLFAFGV